MRGLLGSILDLGLHAESHLPSTVPRILICGDADFKYARALQSRLDALGGAGARGPQIFASAFEPEEELVSKYPDAAERMASLRADGAWVGCGVDARTLEAHFPNAPPWERIVFNLPQAPPMPKARNQIQRHRALLREFCASAASVLSPDGQLWITLLAGQGGTPLDLVAREEGNHWQLQREAARSGLLVAAVDLPDLGELEDSGYLPTGRGYRGRELGPRRQAQGLVTHVLVHEGRCPAVAPLEWAFDNRQPRNRNKSPPGPELGPEFEPEPEPDLLARASAVKPRPPNLRPNRAPPKRKPFFGSCDSWDRSAIGPQGGGAVGTDLSVHP